MNELVLSTESKAITSFDVMKQQASVMLKSGFLPTTIKTAEQALMIMMVGQELNIPPTLALRKITVIQGQPTLAPELLLALAIQRVAGFSYEWGKCDNETATFVANRPGLQQAFVSTFTLKDAENAKLLGKDNWKNYPANMLRWRACANALHAVCPDTVLGFYTPDEMGALTNETGEIIIDTDFVESHLESPAVTSHVKTITDKQRGLIFALIKSTGISREEFKKRYPYEWESFPISEASNSIEFLKSLTPAKETESQIMEDSDIDWDE